MKENKSKYEYYNEERKQRYIDYCKQTTNIEYGVLERLFTYTNPFEEQYDKDCCSFTTAEIRNMYKETKGGEGFRSREVLANTNSQLKRYSSWCRETDNSWVPDNQNHYVEILSDDYKEFLNIRKIRNTIITRKELLNSLYALVNECDQFVMLAIFEGICGPDKQEILNLKLSDFYRKDGQWYANVHYDVIDRKTLEKLGTKERTVAVSNELRDLAEMAAAQTSYKSVFGDRETRFTDDQSPDVVVKKVFNRDNTKHYNRGKLIYRRINFCLDLLKSQVNMGRENKLSDLSLISLMHSGILNMIGNIAEANQISKLQVLYDNTLLKNVDQQYDINLRVTKSVFRRKYEEYFEE